MIDSYAWSDDEEHYDGGFSSREEALAEGRASTDDETTIYTGRCAEPEVPCGGFAEDIVIRLSERVYEECGDLAEEFLWHPSVTKEQLHDLDTEIRDALEVWLDRHDLRPKWFSVVDVKEHLPIEKDERDDDARASDTVPE